MKNKYLALGFILASASIISLTSFKPETIGLEKSFHLSKFSNSGPVAKTGAPGEGTCTQCHAGSILDGATVNTITLGSGSDIVPGAMTSVTLDFGDAGSKNGFQVTVLDETNTMAGTLSSADATTQISTGMGRTYVNHTSSSLSNSTWSFNWTAPSANIPTVTFYVATNKSNANNQNSGDLIYNSQHVFSQAGAGLFSEVKQEVFFDLGYSPNENAIVLDYFVKEQDNAVLTVVDLKGQTLLLENLGEVFEGENSSKFALPLGIKPGIYVAHFFVGNKGGSRKFFVK
ncbi:MAG: choice-of-anchor V domain-containing protein [Lishizhenia sp.]